MWRYGSDRSTQENSSKKNGNNRFLNQLYSAYNSRDLGVLQITEDRRRSTAENRVNDQPPNSFNVTSNTSPYGPIGSPWPNVADIPLPKEDKDASSGKKSDS